MRGRRAGSSQVLARKPCKGGHFPAVSSIGRRGRRQATIARPTLPEGETVAVLTTASRTAIDRCREPSGGLGEKQCGSAGGSRGPLIGGAVGRSTAIGRQLDAPICVNYPTTNVRIGGCDHCIFCGHTGATSNRLQRHRSFGICHRQFQTEPP
jgi:hypothetical protein